MKNIGQTLIVCLILLSILSIPVHAKETQSNGQPFEEIWSEIGNLGNFTHEFRDEVMNKLNEISAKISAIDTSLEPEVKNQITDIHDNINDPDNGLVSISHKIDNIKVENVSLKPDTQAQIDDIQNKLNNPAFGLEETKQEVAIIETEIFNSTHGLTALRTAIDNIALSGIGGQNCPEGSVVTGVDGNGNLICKVLKKEPELPIITFPDIADNMVEIEISGIQTSNDVYMVIGPGLEIEIIEGFAYNKPYDLPGLSMEFPIVMEYSGADVTTFQQWYDDFQSSGHRRDMSMIVKKADGNEAFRWNAYEVIPVEILPGTDGRTRIVLNLLGPNDNPPDNILRIERDGGTPQPIPGGNNPETDKRVEISGVDFGNPWYPGVEVDATNRTIILTIDYLEGGGTGWNWIKNVATGYDPTKRDLSIIDEENGAETGRMNYFGVFPYRYQQYNMGLDIKSKERIWIRYDFREIG